MEMETHPQGSEERLTSRPPTEVDLISICDGLNKAGAQYVVVGGWAIIQSGYPRYTEGIPLDPPPRPVDPDEGLPAWAKAVVAALRFLFKKH